MVEIEVLTLGELATNCYVVADPKTRTCLVIDPADEGGLISQKLIDTDWRLMGIILTHGHFDHVLGLLELSLNFPSPILLHQADLFLIKRAAAQARKYLGRIVDPVPIPNLIWSGQTSTQLTALIDGLSVALGQFQLIHTPGHTPGSLCLYHPTGHLIAGDTLFAGSVGRTDFPYSRPQQLLTSLQLLAKSLPPRTQVWPGHGPATRLDQELAQLKRLTL